MISTIAASEWTTPDKRAVILCVDDEQNILSSLRRVFRPLECEILLANSAASGLAILEEKTVNVVISDMRMPEMNGAEFLTKVRAQWPATLRILLTGYADVQLIGDAINSGEIYRYITKPWDDVDILLTLRLAIERQMLEAERQRLTLLTAAQNADLKELNANLERKVDQRTAELSKVHHALVASNEKLKKNFLTSIKVLASIIEMRTKNLAGHSRSVADLARRIALRMGLTNGEAQTIFVAGLLHNIGKVGFPDALLDKPVSIMTGDELGQYRKYPSRGEQLLMPLDELQDAAHLVRSHQERFDGNGFPDGLSGFDIPIGARILAVASDYEKHKSGLLTQRQLQPAAAANVISDASGLRYDPAVVAALNSSMYGNLEGDVSSGTFLTTASLRPGMVTMSDLIRRDGSLLLSADHVLDQHLIQQIIDFEKSSSQLITVHIRSKGV